MIINSFVFCSFYCVTEVLVTMKGFFYFPLDLLIILKAFQKRFEQKYMIFFFKVYDQEVFVLRA